MQIRPALPTDIDEFYNLFREIMNEGYSGYSEEIKKRFLEKDYSITNFQVWLDRFFRYILLAYHEEQLVGFLVGDYTYGGVGFISWLGVRKDMRGSRVGKTLYLEYERFAKNKNAHLLQLYTYPKVEEFYIKLGFKRIGIREQGYYGQKNIIMNKKIGEWNDLSLKYMI